MTQPLDLAPIIARVEAATEGPWFVHVPDPGYCIDHIATAAPGLSPTDDDQWRNHIATLDGSTDTFQADSTFIAHARQDIPALIAEVRRLRAELAAARQSADDAHDAEMSRKIGVILRRKGWPF